MFDYYGCGYTDLHVGTGITKAKITIREEGGDEDDILKRICKYSL